MRKHVENFIINVSSNDATTNMLRLYFEKSVANILDTLHCIGLFGSNIRFIMLPDFTFSKNEYRLSAGITNGTIMQLDTNGVPFVPIEFRPNCCGVTLGKIKKWNGNIDDIFRRMKYLKDILKNNINVVDMCKSNHFLGIYWDKIENEYYILLHCSFDFVKAGTNEVPGLYPERTNHWASHINKSSTIPFLIGEVAEQYFQVYKQHEINTKKIRRLIIETLFPNIETIFNETHEGFHDISTFIYGAYVSSDSFFAPIMLSQEQSLPLIQTVKVVDGINLYCSPHGGGYSINNIVMGNYNATTNWFEINFNNDVKSYVSDIRSLEHSYRTDTANIWSNEYGFSETLKELIPLYNIKLAI